MLNINVAFIIGGRNCQWMLPLKQQDTLPRVRGEFVLRKRQLTKNEEVAVELIDIRPPKPCAEESSFQSGARARIRFIRVWDRSVICEHEVRERQSGNLPESCSNELAVFGITGFEIPAINVRDKWILLRLFA